MVQLSYQEMSTQKLADTVEVLLKVHFQGYNIVADQDSSVNNSFPLTNQPRGDVKN